MRVNWPPSEQGWREILRGLPPNADRRAVRAMVETAVEQYVADEDAKRQRCQLWRNLKKQAGSKSVAKICRTIRQLPRFPVDPDVEYLWGIADDLARVAKIAEVRAGACLPRNRRRQLLAIFSAAWTGPGKGQMPRSETGPFVNFLSELTGRVLTRELPDGHIVDGALGGGAVKDLVTRERIRRAALNLPPNAQHARGQGKLTTDEKGIFLLPREAA